MLIKVKENINNNFKFHLYKGGIEIIDYIGKDKNVIIPEEIDGKKVISIGENAFYDNDLTSIIIPPRVTNIGESAFFDNKLTSIIIPPSVTYIGESAFFNNKLNSITIPPSVQTIGKRAFSDNKLTSIIIPPSVIYIGEKAFYNNDNLNKIILIDINVLSNSDSLFFDCGSNIIIYLLLPKNNITKKVLNFLTPSFINNDKKILQKNFNTKNVSIKYGYNEKDIGIDIVEAQKKYE